jgi:hypothetical protein
MATRNRLATLATAGAVIVSLALSPASGAGAAWATQGAGGAAGAASVMPTGATPGATVIRNQVTVSWAPSTLSNGTDVSGYIVNRYNAATGGTATVGAGCSGVVTTTSCTEDSVPPGTWVYTETPVRVNWTGGQSAESAPVVVPLT